LRRFEARKRFGAWWNAVSTDVVQNGVFLMLAMWFAGLGGFGLGNMSGLALPILFFVVLYFLMIVPNQRKQKKWSEMLAQLKSGDKVTTNGGIKGTVLTVKDDVVILRVQPDGVKLEFVKSAIAAVTTDEPAST
jgi:preprotein translocase subunit YajC